MTYLAFLLILILAGLVFGLARLFASKVSFQTVFEIIATALVMLPVVAMSLALCGAIAMGLILIVAGILAAIGWLPIVSGWAVWGWAPFWLWLVFGALSVFAAGHVYDWAKERRRGATKS
jgi:hypothetical protein